MTEERWVSRPKVSPIYQSAAYAFAGLDEVEAVQDHTAPGYIYARYSNPNTAEIEAEMMTLERAPAALAVASGMAAMYCSLLSILRPGDHIVAGDTLYGGTMSLLTNVLPRWNVTTTFCDTSSAAAVRAAICPATKAIVAETISNPLLDVADVDGIGELAKKCQIAFVVDNTFATPLLCRPLELGASIVVHSVTKFLAGHSDVMLGIAAGSAQLVESARSLAITAGTNADPFAAWLASRGLRTLDLRVERQCGNAARVARYLNSHPGIARTYYPGLRSHRGHGRALRLFGGSGGPMVTAELDGGRDACDRFIRALRLIRFVPSLGDIATTLSHPATTSHRNLSEDERQRRGISDGLFRLSIGCETPDEIIADLDQALPR